MATKCMFPPIDEHRKHKFRRKSWTVYHKLSPSQQTSNEKGTLIPTGTRFQLFPPDTSVLDPPNLQNWDHLLNWTKRGQRLWKKASETLVLPLLYVTVKQRQRSNLRMLRQSTLKKLFITKVIMVRTQALRT